MNQSKLQIALENKKYLDVYVCHLKSNRDNEFEYIFTKDASLEDKKNKVKKALEDNYSLSKTKTLWS